MPLTAEEKKQRAKEKKAQKLKEAEELRIKTRKDELAREVRTAQANVAEYMKQWYERNYAGRFPQLHEDMEVAWHSYEHTVDLKEFIISELMDKMDEAKLQQAMSWQDYTIKIDNMISDYHESIEKLQREYQASVKELQLEAANMSSALDMDQNNLEDYYKTVLYSMEEQFAEMTTVTQGEYITKRDEEEKKGVHAIEVLSAALEKSLQTTVTDIKDTVEEYQSSTKARRKELEELRAKDDFYMDMIRRQDTRMAKLSEEQSNLQSQINEDHESRLLLEDLKKDCEETHTEFTEVKAKLGRDAASDESHLLTLTTESNGVIKDLEHISEKGEKILRLAALCRRLETQEEKVTPFGAPADINAGEQMEEDSSSPFRLFWRRYARANIIKKQLECTLAKLQNENRMLKENLETVLEIMALTNMSTPKMESSVYG